MIRKLAITAALVTLAACSGKAPDNQALANDPANDTAITTANGMLVNDMMQNGPDGNASNAQQ